MTTSDRDTLAALINAQGYELDRGPHVAEWPVDEQEIHRTRSHRSFDERREAVQQYRVYKLAGLLIAAGWRPPVREITTATDLSNLPARSLVLVPDGPRAGVWRAKRSPGWWWCIDRDDHAATHELLMCGEGTVTVLHVPTEEAACPHDSRSGDAGGRWRCDECGADCGPDTYLTTTEEGGRG